MDYHIHVICDGKDIQMDGLPQDRVSLPESLKNGFQMIYSLVESRVNGLDCICVGGIFYDTDVPSVCAFDIWVQLGDEGYYLPMPLCEKLFSDNGIPYYHSPFMS